MLILLPLLYLMIYTIPVFNVAVKTEIACGCEALLHMIDNLDARSIEDSLIKMNDCMLLGPESEVNCKLNHSEIELSCTL